MRGIFFSLVTWMLMASLVSEALSVSSYADFERGIVEAESQVEAEVSAEVEVPAEVESPAEDVEGFKRVQLTNGEGPFFYYTVTIGETVQDSCSYEYAFSENDVLYYLLNVKNEDGQYSNYLRGFDAFTGELTADDIKLINAETSYELLDIARSDNGYFVWAFDAEKSSDHILQLSFEGDIVAETSFNHIISMKSDSPDFYYRDGKRVNVDSLVSDGRNVYVFFDGNRVRLTDKFRSVIFAGSECLGNGCIGTDGMIYYNNFSNGGIFLWNPSNNTTEFILNPFRGATKIFPDINNELLITDGEMIRFFNPAEKTVRKSFRITEFGLCEICVDDIFRDSGNGLHIVYREQRVAYDTQNGGKKVVRHPYYVSRTTVLSPLGTQIRISPEDIDPYCDEKYNVTTVKIETSEPEFIEPFPRIVSDGYLYITMEKEDEDGDWLLKRDISGKGRPDECHRLELGAPDSIVMNFAWAGNGEFIAYAYDLDDTDGELKDCIVRMTDDGKLLEKKFISEFPELSDGDLWDKPVSDGKITCIIHGTEVESSPVLLDKDFGYVRQFPVDYSRNAFDAEGLLYLLDQASGMISYYDRKTDTFTPNVDYILLYPNEAFNGGHKEVLIKRDSCFFSYSSEDGITEKLFNMFDYGFAVEEVYDCYREGDDSFVVVFDGSVTSLRLSKNGTYMPSIESGTFKAVFEKNE